MTESALRAMIANLEACRSSLHAWLHFWTFLVVVGVASEIIFVIWEYWEDLHDFRNGFIHAPEKPNVWLLVLGLLGAGLVTVGVAGELEIDAQLGAVETNIGKANDDLYLLLSKEAGDAKISADGAALAASRAQASADAANAAVNEILGKISKLRSESGARRITVEQRNKFRKALEAVALTPVTIRRNPEDSEAGDLAKDFADAFAAVHWPTAGVIWAPNDKYGIFLGFTDKEILGVPAFQSLKDALSGIGMPPTLLPLAVGDRTLSPAAESHVLYLLIATHPPVKADAR